MNYIYILILTSMAYDTAEFHQKVEELLQDWKVPGLAIAVVRGEGAPYAKGYGFATAAGPVMERVTEDTIFDIGDISKSFTAAAVALLVDRQILSWNTTIKDLVPRNRMKHYENCNEIADYRSVTVEDALCHRSGMPSHDRAYIGHNGIERPCSAAGCESNVDYTNYRDTPESVAGNFDNLPKTAKPGLNFQYSNYMYTMLGHIVEIKANAPEDTLDDTFGSDLADNMAESVKYPSATFGEFLKDNIWRPLGMNGTYLGYNDIIESEGSDVDFSDVEEEDSDIDMGDTDADNTDGDGGVTQERVVGESPVLARGHYWDENIHSNIVLDWQQSEEVQGALWVFSTVKDTALWLQAMMNSTKILSKDAYEKLRTPKMAVQNDDRYHDKPHFGITKYAFGHYIDTYRKTTTIVGHDGSAPGFGSLMRYLPDRNWGAVIFGNSPNASTVAEILFMHLLDEELNIDITERVDWSNFWKKRHEASGQGNIEPNSGNSELDDPQKYAGLYWNPGYHTLHLQVDDDGNLEANCYDRSFPFRLTFEYQPDSKARYGCDDDFEAIEEYRFKVTICNIGGKTENAGAIFYINKETGVVQSLGIQIEKQMETKNILFDKVNP